MQRFFDVLFSGFALLVLSPLVVPLAVLLRLTGEGEIFFLQERVGKGGTPFKLYKFATMLKNSPNLGTGTVTVKNDPRILPLGGWMRKTKINELPQLLNILKGDMSIIGPRPQTQRCFEAFAPLAQNAIVQVRPGLSGVGSIIFRDEEDMMDGHEDPAQFYDDAIAPFKGSLEEWYVMNQGLRTYFTLIFLTVWVVLAPRSQFVWRVLKNLPRPAPVLARALLAGEDARELIVWADTIVVRHSAQDSGVQALTAPASEPVGSRGDPMSIRTHRPVLPSERQRAMESTEP